CTPNSIGFVWRSNTSRQLGIFFVVELGVNGDCPAESSIPGAILNVLARIDDCPRPRLPNRQRFQIAPCSSMFPSLLRNSINANSRRTCPETSDQIDTLFLIDTALV